MARRRRPRPPKRRRSGHQKMKKPGKHGGAGSSQGGGGNPGFDPGYNFEGSGDNPTAGDHVDAAQNQPIDLADG
jgi:hypothetical protein